MTLLLALALVAAVPAGVALAVWWWQVGSSRAPRLEPADLCQRMLHVFALEAGAPAPDTSLLEDGPSPLLASGATPWRLRLWAAPDGGEAAPPPVTPGEALIVCGGAAMRPALEQRSGQPVLQLLPGERPWASRDCERAPELRRLVALVLTRVRHSSSRPFLELQPDERAALVRPLDAAAARWAGVLRWRLPLLSYALLAFLLVVFTLEIAWGGSTFVATLDAMGALYVAAARHGQVWRLLSHGSLHIGFQHMLFNALAVIAFSSLLEGCLGRARFMTLWVLSVLGGGIATTLVGSAGTLSAGASGGLWGLMGAMLGLGVERRRLLPEEVRRRMRKGALNMLVVNGLISMMPGIGWLAHLGGGITGFALVGSGLLTARLTDARPGAPSALSRLALSAGALVLLLSLGLAWAVGKPWQIAWPAATWVRQSVPGAGLSIELPPDWLLSERQRSGTSVTYSTGPLGSAPLAISLQVSEADPVEDASRRGAPHKRQEYSLPNDAGRGEGWSGVIGTKRFRLDVVQWHGTTAAWRKATGRFVASLRAEPSGPR